MPQLDSNGHACVLTNHKYYIARRKLEDELEEFKKQAVTDADGAELLARLVGFNITASNFRSIRRDMGEEFTTSQSKELALRRRINKIERQLEEMIDPSKQEILTMKAEIEAIRASMDG